MLFRLWIPFLCLCVAGCEDARDVVVPVSGVVIYQGKPLANATVIFSPQPEKKATFVPPDSASLTDEEGRFSLETQERNWRKGAVPGKHAVQVIPEMPDIGPEESVSLTDLGYSDDLVRGRSFIVPDDGADDVRLIFD